MKPLNILFIFAVLAALILFGNSNLVVTQTWGELDVILPENLVDNLSFRSFQNTNANFQWFRIIINENEVFYCNKDTCSYLQGQGNHYGTINNFLLGISCPSYTYSITSSHTSQPFADSGVITLNGCGGPVSSDQNNNIYQSSNNVGGNNNNNGVLPFTFKISDWLKSFWLFILSFFRG